MKDRNGPVKLKHLLMTPAFAFGAVSAEAQDISVSMGECAAIYDVLTESASYRGKSKEQVDQMLAVSAEFKVHAIQRASQEGKREPEQSIQDTYNTK